MYFHRCIVLLPLQLKMKRFFRAQQARTSCTGAGGTAQPRRPVSCSGIPSRSTGAVPAAFPPTQRLFYRTVTEQQQVRQDTVQQQQQQESTGRKEDKGKGKGSGREQRLEELMQLQRQRHSLRQQQQQEQGRRSQEVDDSMLGLDSTNCVCTVFSPMSSKTKPNKNGHQNL
jgi:hypothetical protein